jgi:hypothetical protein
LYRLDDGEDILSVAEVDGDYSIMDISAHRG